MKSDENFAKKRFYSNNNWDLKENILLKDQFDKF